MKGPGEAMREREKMVSGEAQGSKQGGTRPRRAWSLQDGRWACPKGSGRPERGMTSFSF